MENLVQSFRDRVEEFLARTGMPISRLGLDACGDKSFVSDLRRGNRDFQASTIEKVDAFMRDYRVPGSGPSHGRAA